MYQGYIYQGMKVLVGAIFFFLSFHIARSVLAGDFLSLSINISDTMCPIPKFHQESALPNLPTSTSSSEDAPTPSYPLHVSGQDKCPFKVTHILGA